MADRHLFVEYSPKLGQAINNALNIRPNSPYGKSQYPDHGRQTLLAQPNSNFVEEGENLPFDLTIDGGTILNIGIGFASRNGTVVQVDAGTVSLAQISASGYLMLRAPWVQDSQTSEWGWGDFERVVVTSAGGTVAITDADYPLGYVTISSGTVSAIESAESFHPAMAIFIKAGTCSE